MRILTAIPFSPWSEKARWALDHHRVDYREVSFMPVVGELVLRLRMRKPCGRVTVPVLQDGSRWFTDSFDIALRAEEVGRGAPLFPSDELEEIRTWNQRSEAALAAGRAILMRSWASRPELALAALPPGLPPALKVLLQPLGKLRLEAFMAKYEIREGDYSHEAILETELDGLAKALSGRRYLVGGCFSYADIAMALTLQQVHPVDPRYILRLSGLGPAGMNIDVFAHRYPDLIAWRDALYASHRRPDATTSGSVARSDASQT